MSAMQNFEVACRNGDVATVKRLIEDHGDLADDGEQWNQDLQRGLSGASWQGHSAVVAILLSHGAKVDESSLSGANRHLGVLEEFVNHRFDLNSTDSRGEPPLRLAMSPEVTKWMLQHGANPNVTNSRGVTPLTTAVIADSTEQAGVLLQHGAALESHLIHRAIRNSSMSGISEGMLRFLLEAGLDINHVLPAYGTPLQLATRLGLKDNVKLLLQLGADPNLAAADENDESFTPAEIAKQSDLEDIYDLLKDATSRS